LNNIQVIKNSFVAVQSLRHRHEFVIPVSLLMWWCIHKVSNIMMR